MSVYHVGDCLFVLERARGSVSVSVSVSESMLCRVYQSTKADPTTFAASTLNAWEVPSTALMTGNICASVYVCVRAFVPLCVCAPTYVYACWLVYALMVGCWCGKNAASV